MWKNNVQPGRDHRRQHGACALQAGYLRLQTKHQNMYYLLLSPLQQRLRERASVFRFICIACIVYVKDWTLHRLRWAAHVMRMENTITTRKMAERTPYKTRPVMRPRLRWMDQVEEDLKRIKIVGWRAKVEDRQEWSRIVEQTETHPGL